MSEFLNFISDMKSPKIQIIESIDKDDVQKLKSLFEKYPEFNDEKKELYTYKNILHYSISQRAVSCVSYLVDTAKWSITYCTVLTSERDWNAIMYAFTECYLPILYIVIRRYCGTEQSNSLKWSALRAWLPKTAPHFSLVYQLLTPDADNRKDVEEMLTNGDFKSIVPHPVYLATELFLSDKFPSKSTSSSNRYSENWTPYDAYGIKRGNDIQLDTWWRALSEQPLLLSEIARRAVRNSILKAAGKPGACGDENYFHRVDRLRMPEVIKQYLCYADLWPKLSKDEKIYYLPRGVSKWRAPQTFVSLFEPYNPDEMEVNHYF